MKTNEKFFPKSLAIYRNEKFAGTITLDTDFIPTKTEEEMDDLIYFHFPSLNK